MSRHDVYISKEVGGVIDLYGNLVDQTAYRRPIEGQLRLLAQRLGNGFGQKHPGTFFELSNWHPVLVGKSQETVWSAKLDDGDYLITVAREHGYENWDNVNSHADMYGGNQTVLGLLLTSRHPAEAGVTKEIQELLIGAGAK